MRLLEFLGSEAGTTVDRAAEQVRLFEGGAVDCRMPGTQPQCAVRPIFAAGCL